MLNQGEPSPPNGDPGASVALWGDGASGPPLYRSISHGLFAATILLLLPRQYGSAAIAFVLSLAFSVAAARVRKAAKAERDTKADGSPSDGDPSDGDPPTPAASELDTAASDTSEVLAAPEPSN